MLLITIKIFSKLKKQLKYNADMRAIKRWREANPGNDLVLPDHADLVVWLIEQLDAKPDEPETKG